MCMSRNCRRGKKMPRQQFLPSPSIIAHHCQDNQRLGRFRGGEQTPQTYEEQRKKVCGSSWWTFAKLWPSKSSQIHVFRPAAYANTDPTLAWDMHPSHHQTFLILAHSWEKQPPPPKYIWNASSFSFPDERIILYYSNIASFCALPFIFVVKYSSADCLPCYSWQPSNASWDQRQFCFKSRDSWCNVATDTSHAFSHGGQGRQKLAFFTKDGASEVRRCG